MVTFHPLSDRVVIKPLQREERTKTGIVLPDTAKEKPQLGEVVAVGPGRVTDEGKHLSPEVKVGDQVIYSKYAGTEYKEGDQEYLILKEADILAKVGK